MQQNCPICNKAGLPDYTAELTICPQCNSDLKPFLVLHTLSKQRLRKRPPLILISVLIGALVFVALYFNSLSKMKVLAHENAKTLLQMQDSLSALQTTLQESHKSQKNNNILVRETTVQYRIKNGDCLSKISQFFYNDWRMYKKIEEDNNLKSPNKLKVGQTLIIKLSQ